MTPPPTDPNSIWVDAGISGGLGVLAGIVRWLMSNDQKSYGYHMRQLVVAGITAYFAGLAIRDLIDSEGLRFASAGATGYVGIALWDLASDKLKVLLSKIGG